MDCSLLGSSVHGIFQARVLEWDAIAFSALWSEQWPKNVLQVQTRVGFVVCVCVCVCVLTSPGSRVCVCVLTSPGSQGCLGDSACSALAGCTHTEPACLVDSAFVTALEH